MNYGRKETERYIHTRIEQISKLHISVDHKMEKLASVEKAVSAFRRGMVTEEELLWLIA